MNHTHLKYLFFVTKPYSFSILEPIQNSISETKSGTVKWFSASSAANFSCPGDQLTSNKEVINYNRMLFSFQAMSFLISGRD